MAGRKERRSRERARIVVICAICVISEAGMWESHQLQRRENMRISFPLLFRRVLDEYRLSSCVKLHFSRRRRRGKGGRKGVRDIVPHPRFLFNTGGSPRYIYPRTPLCVRPHSKPRFSPTSEMYDIYIKTFGYYFISRYDNFQRDSIIIPHAVPASNILYNTLHTLYKSNTMDIKMAK